MAAFFAAVLSAIAFAPTPVWANGPSASPAWEKSSDESSQEASRLMVVADFNRDGIADIAKATSPAGDPYGRGVLTVSLVKRDGSLQQTFSKPVLGHDPRSMAAVDANRDGIPDLIVGDDDGSLMCFLAMGWAIWLRPATLPTWALSSQSQWRISTTMVLQTWPSQTGGRVR
jgi:hypothetical protein